MLRPIREAPVSQELLSQRRHEECAPVVLPWTEWQDPLLERAVLVDWVEKAGEHPHAQSVPWLVWS